MLRLTIATEDGSAALMQISATATLGELQRHLQARYGIAPHQQVLKHDGQPLPDAPEKHIRSLGVHDNDLLLLSFPPITPQRTTASRARSPNQQRASAVPDSVLARDLALQEHLGLRVPPSQLSSPATTHSVRSPTASVVDVSAVSAEEQRRIERQIQKHNIARNMHHALDVIPEAFSAVPMLYLACEVNKTPVKAFVDTGAQMTIMSEGMARRCSLSHLIDSRWHGTAVGVGAASIKGRIHMAEVLIGGLIFPLSFSIMEVPGPEIILGLDMLLRHQAVLDLRQKKLHFGSVTVPLLLES